MENRSRQQRDQRPHPTEIIPSEVPIQIQKIVVKSKKPQPFTPEDLEPILSIASQCGMILVGGQAVNTWAVLLEDPEAEPWKSLRPYTSRDADLLSSEIQMMRFAKELTKQGWGVEVFHPEGKEKKINVGAMRIQGEIAGTKKFLEINLLKELQGLSVQEIEENKQEVPIKEKSIHVIDCLRLLESKTISLNTLDQTDRQDRKHLILCVASLNELLKIGAKSAEPETILATAKRIVQNAQSGLGLDTQQHHNVKLLDAIPWKEWQTHSNPQIKAFADKESLFKTEIGNNIEEARELKTWIQDLYQKKPPKEELNDIH
jgi:hypothetical protein